MAGACLARDDRVNGHALEQRPLSMRDIGGGGLRRLLQLSDLDARCRTRDALLRSCFANWEEIADAPVSRRLRNQERGRDNVWRAAMSENESEPVKASEPRADVRVARDAGVSYLQIP